MTTKTWAELGYSGTGDRTSVPEGTYPVQIKAARTYAQSSMLFLDLEVLQGPEQGKTAQVNLYVPPPGGKGFFFFAKKTAGLLEGPPAGFGEALEVGDTEQALNALASALEGRTCYATLSVRTDGDYAGSNELESTKPFDGGSPVPQAAPVPQPAPAAPTAAPVPAPAVPAPAPAPVPAAVAAAPVADDDVPF